MNFATLLYEYKSVTQPSRKTEKNTDGCVRHVLRSLGSQGKRLGNQQGPHEIFLHANQTHTAENNE